MNKLRIFLGSTRKQAPAVQFQQAQQNRFTKTMPGESAALASLRLGHMAL